MILVGAAVGFIASVHLLVGAVFVLLELARRKGRAPLRVGVSSDAIGQRRCNIEGPRKEEGSDHESY
jgi:hypothetical protein